MEQSKKKAFLIKIKAVGRTLKEFKLYKDEVDAFDMAIVSQDKRQTQFYNQSLSAMESAKKSMIQFVNQLDFFIDENKEEIEEIEDEKVSEQVEKGNNWIKEARELLPGEL